VGLGIFNLRFKRFKHFQSYFNQGMFQSNERANKLRINTLKHSSTGIRRPPILSKTDSQIHRKPTTAPVGGSVHTEKGKSKTDGSKLKEKNLNELNNSGSYDRQQTSNNKSAAKSNRQYINKLRYIRDTTTSIKSFLRLYRTHKQLPNTTTIKVLATGSMNTSAIFDATTSNKMTNQQHILS
jgi:hypothetical protein